MKRTRPARRRTTIHDVARMATVSPTTVSNVLNGRTSSMTPETLQRVQSAIRRLRYRPNSAARGLVTRRMATIGLVLAEIETPLFLQALHTIEPIVRGGGYNLLLCIARNTEDERQALDLLLEKQADGIIFLSTSQYQDDAHLGELKNIGIPVVLVNRARVHDCFDQINWDNVAGIGQAVDFLARMGHQHIAHLRGPEKRRSSFDRLNGYRLALERNGLAYCQQLVQPGDFTASPDSWRESALKLLALDPRPTAIIASDDIVGATAMKTIQGAGLRVPDDLAVVGCDDQPFCALLNPSLTTVQLPVIESGKRAAEMLLERISGERSEVEHIILPCPLVLRDSAGRPADCAPVADLTIADTTTS